jgi:hypothetical protein
MTKLELIKKQKIKEICENADKFKLNLKKSNLKFFYFEYKKILIRLSLLSDGESEYDKFALEIDGKTIFESAFKRAKRTVAENRLLDIFIKKATGEYSDLEQKKISEKAKLFQSIKF